MEVYSKDATPRVDKVSGKNYYEGATSYKAADINDVENSVQTVIGDLTVEIESAVTNFDKLIQELDENFGVKFIKLNDQKLGFVDVEAFNTLTKNLKTSLETSSNNATTFFGTSKGNITDINTWLTELQTNAEEYSKLEKSYNADTTGIIKNPERAAKTKQEMDTYTKLPNEPISYGDWIRE